MRPDHFRQLYVKRRIIMSDINGFQITGSLKRHRRFLKMCLLILCFAALALLTQKEAQGVNIENQPMEAAATSAAPNIMFVLDNSGSMDWEFMTRESDGLFRNEYYLFNSGDNAYFGQILDGGDQAYFKGQCAGYNKIYYNPKSDYRPWPSTSTYTFSDADINDPRSNPINAGSTLNLSDQYFSIANCGSVTDDLDGAPYFTKTGLWNTYTGAGTYNGRNFYTWNAGTFTAQWRSFITDTGVHQVYAWWDSWASYHNNVIYKVTHAGGTTDVTVDQSTNGNGWFYLGNFTFNSGTNAVVEMDFTSNTGEAWCADAIRIVPNVCPPAIRINNAHYYIWDDTNADRNMDIGENVYLVNFTDPNSDGDLSDVSRDYYRIDDDGDGYLEPGELAPISELPDWLKPAIYDTEGNFDHYKTDAEDLQNFANWYSYYRRRELAAKAAVAHTVNDLTGVYVGFYSINTGLRQSVLPVELNCAAGAGGGNAIIVDNGDSRYAENAGSWRTWNGQGYLNSSRYTYSGGPWTATWTPILPNAGQYNVYARWPYWNNGDTNALYTINYDGGQDTDRKNQRQNADQWNLLGTYQFAAGTSGDVKVTRDNLSTGGDTEADAVMFEPLAAPGNPLVFRDDTEILLDKLYQMNSSGGTPLRAALDNVGKYYDADDGHTGNLGNAPWASCPDGGECQKSFSIAMTDGYWNGSSPADVGNQDLGQGAPYTDNHSTTLADVAMKYYKNDLSVALENRRP